MRGLVQDLTADRIDLPKLTLIVLDEDLSWLYLVDQRAGADQRRLYGVDAEVKLAGINAVAKHLPVAE